jgi:hypothetical protein
MAAIARLLFFHENSFKIWNGTILTTIHPVLETRATPATEFPYSVEKLKAFVEPDPAFFLKVSMTFCGRKSWDFFSNG